MWHLVVLVAAVLWHLVGLKHLLGETFLTLLLLVQCVRVKACAEFVVPNGAQSGDINLNGGVQSQTIEQHRPRASVTTRPDTKSRRSTNGCCTE